MKILVTGGAGYIGSITTKVLLEAGHEVVVFDNLERGHLEAVDPRALFVQGDLRHRQEIRQAMLSHRPQAVVHFAAYAYVGESVRKPLEYYRNNVGGGIALVEAMAEAEVRRIVFSSSCATYGEPEKLPIVESTPQSPTNPYGETKLTFERLLLWARETMDFEPVFLRYFNAAGAGLGLGEDHDPETHLIPLILQVALGERERIEVFGDDYDTDDGTCVRDYVHIADLAAAHSLALSKDVVGAFNLGTGVGYSVRQIIDAAVEVTGRSIASTNTPRRPGDPPTLVANAEKAMDALSWQPRSSDLKTILADAWDWHRRHPKGYSSPGGKGWRETL